MSSGALAQIALGRPMAMPGQDPAKLLAAAAAAAAPGSNDPVDRAAFQAAAASSDLCRVHVDFYNAPDEGRRFSLSKVNGLGDSDITVARGDFAAVAGLCGLDHHAARTADGMAKRCHDAGFRPWAIASAPEGGDWSLLGVIPVKATRAGRASDRSSFTFVRIWSFLLRFLHWSWALLILILVATGLEIQTMYLSAGTTRTYTGFYFGYVRLIHLTCGWLLAAVMLARIADALITRNRFEDWRALIPVKGWADLKGFFEEALNYVLLRNDEGKKYLGHDPLAQVSFTFIYLVMLAVIVSGFSLYGLYDPQHWFFSWFQWPIRHFGANQVRLFHVTMMWLIILFVPIHLYLVIRADGYAREGSLSAMLSGGRWVRRGASFADAPDPEALDLTAKR